MSEWFRGKLGEILELKRGYDLPARLRISGKIPVISSGGFSDYHADSKVKGPGVVTGRYGTIGKVFFVNEEYWPLNTTLYVKNFKGNHPKFIYYFLQQIDFQSCSDKAAVPGLNRNHLHLLDSKIPPLPEQKAIAHILGTLDEKIELNRQLNQTLEAMAQALFKSWFVDFDPVMDNALAAGNIMPDELEAIAEKRKLVADSKKLISTNPALATKFPSSFEYNEVLGKWIPEGWEDVSFPEIVDFLEGPGIRNWQYTEEEDGIKFINIRCIKDGDLTLETANKLTREEALGKYKHFQLEEDDIVISTSGTLGRFSFVRKEHLPLSLNTSVIRFREIKGISTKYYIYGYCNTDLQYELETRASGSVQKNFGPMHLKQISLLHPRMEVLLEHEKISYQLFEKRKLNLQNIDTLTQLRDRLLPELISGRVRVKEIEEWTEQKLAMVAENRANYNSKS
ncbi:restriction endonuclease subunit S [Algoriphagus yeomjeoni]|uniref:Type I restriction enzyme S subunit n=1 Tax=Algoriphagus yeomjeoni TaxID=291403 RepID=A0A327PGY3_9BACT|nr:restriction endonuclease subunit S [Algoriphagus yeomjeoni]RAI91489.1 type I restriction enzyme S subunit [Algoriphagus yeomjeoni]